MFVLFLQLLAGRIYLLIVSEAAIHRTLCNTYTAEATERLQVDGPPPLSFTLLLFIVQQSSLFLSSVI
jgi:hypothetical protein